MKKWSIFTDYYYYYYYSVKILKVGIYFLVYALLLGFSYNVNTLLLVHPPHSSQLPPIIMYPITHNLHSNAVHV